jgi:hypothetical protein
LRGAKPPEKKEKQKKTEKTEETEICSNRKAAAF